MRNILFNMLLLGSVGIYACGDDDEPSQVCTACTHSSGSTTELCGSESDVASLETDWTASGGTCTRK